MNIKMKFLNIFVSLAVAQGLAGCGQNFKLLDHSSDSGNTPASEYFDFSDLPLSDVPDETPETSSQEQKESETLPVNPGENIDPKAAEPKEQNPTPNPKNNPPSKIPKPPETPANAPQPNSPSRPQPTPAPRPQPAPSPTPPKEPIKQPAPTQPTKKTNIGVGTVYYLPVYGEKRNCSKDEVLSMKDENEKKLVLLCKDELWNCAMQGSCFYLDKEGVTLFAYKKMVKIIVPDTKKVISQPRFRPNKEFTLCPQGMGAHRVCLDPYRSIAADPLFHKIGDVVYVPLLRNQKLPNGETHDGYLVVRDTGGNIKGEGRFDFFIGFDDYKGHLFTKLGLATKAANQFVYHLVPEDLAEKVRKARQFPMAPKKVHQNAYASMKQVLGLTEDYAITNLTKEFYKMKLQ